MNYKFLFTGLLLALSSIAAARPMFLSVDKKVLEALKPHLTAPVSENYLGTKATVIQMDDQEIEAFSELIHHKLRRCGGFSSFSDFKAAKSSAANLNQAELGKHYIFADYVVNQQSVIHPMLTQVSEPAIREMILKLSDFKTRRYDTDDGAKAMVSIRDTWAKLSSLRSDVKLELIKHRYYGQHSLVMTVTGSELPEEIVVLGGHADSISSDDTAPGADDNASGIATITEVIRVMMANGIQPKRTIKFMAYAAEEVGLWGSQDLALAHKKAKLNVVGVMQLDMTLFKGTKDKDILLTTDYTNKAQNTFLGKLIDEYVKVPWGYTSCGYSCSDHASWTDAGFPASYPQEAYMDESNNSIHTQGDTLETAGGTADHAVKFAKLGLAFILEMAK